MNELAGTCLREVKPLGNAPIEGLGQRQISQDTQLKGSAASISPSANRRERSSIMLSRQGNCDIMGGKIEIMWKNKTGMSEGA